MKKIKTSTRGRRCKYLKCRHILSIYNHERYCYVHISQLLQAEALKVFKSP